MEVRPVGKSEKHRDRVLKERPLVRPLSLLAFAGAAALGLLLIIPTDFEFASFQTKTYRLEQAEPLLRSFSQKHQNDVVALRNLAELLENRGQAEEAIEISKRLITLRPKNKSYRERLIRLYEWTGKSLEATRAREAAMQDGLFPKTRDAMLALAAEYEWLESLEDSLRLFSQTWKEGMYRARDVVPMVRFFFRMKQPTEARKLASEALEQGVSDRDAHLNLFFAFYEIRDIREAARYAASYLGATPAQAQRAYLDSSWVSELPEDRVHQDLNVVMSMLWMFHENRKKPLCLPILERLEQLSLLKKDLHFFYADLAASLGHPQRSLVILRNISEAHELTAKDWRQIAQRAMNLGQKELSARILEALIDGRTPSLDGVDVDIGGFSWNEPVRGVLVASRDTEASRMETYRLLVEILDAQKKDAVGRAQVERVLRERADSDLPSYNRIPASEGGSAPAHFSTKYALGLIERANHLRKFKETASARVDRLRRSTRHIASTELAPMTASETIETYNLLVGVYDSLTSNRRSIEILNQLLGEMEAGKVKVPEKTRVKVREQIAERYTWETEPQNAVSMLEPVEFESLSVRSRAILALALDEIGETDRAYDTSAKILLPERKPLEPDLKDRLALLDARRESNLEAIAAMGANAAAVLNDFRLSYVDALTYQPTSFVVTPGLSVTNDLSTASTEVEYRSRDDHFGPYIGAKGERLWNLGTEIAAVMAGAWYTMPYRKFEARAGYLLGTSDYWKPQLEATALGTDWMGFQFASLNFSLAMPLTQTRGLAQIGASETRLSAYLEKRFSDSAELTTSILPRVTHKGGDLGAGYGIDLTARLGFGNKLRRWRYGPWVNLTFWDSRDETLKTLLVKRFSIVGPYAQYFFGGGGPMSLRGSATLGWGVDFSAPGINFAQFFLETNVEKLLWSDFGVKFNYAVYTAQVTQTFTGATHLVSLGLFMEL